MPVFLVLDNSGSMRGGKIANFLRSFQRRPSGSVEECDFAALHREILELVARPGEELRTETRAVMRRMHERLEKVAGLLRQVLADGKRS